MCVMPTNILVTMLLTSDFSYKGLRLRISANDHHLVAITANNNTEDIADQEDTGNLAVNIIREAKTQLSEFLDHKRVAFDLPIAPLQGTEFQQRVWKALRDIPYGQTRTYGEIASIVGSPKAARAVGMACNRNPLLIVTPCHRVIGANGSLVGFACGLDTKALLLNIEKKCNLTSKEGYI